MRWRYLVAAVSLAVLAASAAVRPGVAQTRDKTPAPAQNKARGDSPGAAELQDTIARCAACHGADGIAREAEVPDLAGQHDVYRLAQLRNFRSGKRPHKEMRYMSRHMTDAELEAIARYYAQLPH